ncbi:MAG: hypothetical protein AAGJ81_09305 [Verrucomicrobiota bacterium]
MRIIGLLPLSLFVLNPSAQAQSIGLEAERSEFDDQSYSISGDIEAAGHLYVTKAATNNEFLRFSFTPEAKAAFSLLTRSRSSLSTPFSYDYRINGGTWQTVQVNPTTGWTWQSAPANPSPPSPINLGAFSRIGSDPDSTVSNLSTNGGTVTYGNPTSRTDVGILTSVDVTLLNIGDQIVYQCTYNGIQNTTSVTHGLRVGFDLGATSSLHFHSGFGASSESGRFSRNTNGNPFSYGNNFGPVTSNWASNAALQFTDGNTIQATYTLTLVASTSDSYDFEYTVTYQNGGASNTVSQLITGILSNKITGIYHLTNTSAVESDGDTWTVTNASARFESPNSVVSLPAAPTTLDILWSAGELDKVQLGGAPQADSTGANSPAWNQREFPKQAGGFDYGWEAFDSSQNLGIGDKTYVNDYTGVRPLRHAPAGGVHPRILFNPEDIPDIKDRIATTASGQAAFKQLRAYTIMLNLGRGPYDESADYARDASGNPLINNLSFFDFSEDYAKLYNEDPSIWNDPSFDKKFRALTASVMACEAFECLLMSGEFDPDTGLSYAQRTQRLKTASLFWAENAITDPKVNSQDFHYFAAPHMGFIYDFLYNEMTVAERSLFRQALVRVIPDLPRYGSKVAAYSGVSNWTTLDNFEIIPNLAIEWEEGYKPGLTRYWMRQFHNFINYGWYPDGAGYEGIGKNYMMTAYSVAHARRGFSVLGHPNVRAFGHRFLPAITQPFGEGFTGYDGWSGSGRDSEKGQYKFNALDAIGLKWAYPDSHEVDSVWRNYIRTAYGTDSVGYVYQQFRPDDFYLQYMIPAVVFASDYSPSNHWKNDQDFLSERGLAILRSSGESDGMVVHFHCRQDMGGHTDADRNSFNLSSLGRIWVRTTYGDVLFHRTYFHSCPLINGEGIRLNPKDGVKARQPSTITHFSSDSYMAKVSGDATYAYNWEWDWSPGTGDNPRIGTDGWEKVTETWNDFRFTPGTGIEYTTPFHDYAAWEADYPATERMIKRRYNTVEKVKRSLIMNKGPRPYLLIVDDLKKDSSVNDYEWVAQIANDLSIDTTVVDLNPANYRNDIILKEPASTGNRRLLVRVLEAQGLTTAPAVIEEIEYNGTFNGQPYTPNPDVYRQRLIVRSTSVEPSYKILMYPYENGDIIPHTEWVDTDTIEITIGSERRTIDFTDISSASGVQTNEPSLARNPAGSGLHKTEVAQLQNGWIELQADFPSTATPRLWHSSNLSEPWSPLNGVTFQWSENSNWTVSAPLDPAAESAFYTISEN